MQPIQPSLRNIFRSFSGASNLAATAAADSALSSLAAHGLPRFPVPATAVRVLHTPTELHDELVRSSLGARKRVHLASLYLGDGPLETSVVEAVTTSQAAIPSRQLSLLVDYHRARRKGALSLVSRIAHAPNARVHLLASPAAPTAGTIRALGGIGGMLSEVHGVQHTKLAIFDDTVLITGANLSEDYLSNRQDRYMLLRGVPELAAFMVGLLDVLADHSHSCVAVEGDDVVVKDAEPQSSSSAATASAANATAIATATAATTGAASTAARASMARGGFHDGASLSLVPPSAPPAVDPYSGLAEALSRAFADADVVRGGPHAGCAGETCYVVPMMQMGAIGLTQESDAVKALLELAAGGSTGGSTDDDDGTADSGAAMGRQPLPLLLSSPYLNPPAAYIDGLAQPLQGAANATRQHSALAAPAGTTTLLSAAPFASGFYRAGGVKGLIPHVYSALEQRLVGTAGSLGVPLRVEHYAREGWTYHAKGLWMWPEQPPQRSLDNSIGSVRDARPMPPLNGDAAARLGPVLTLIGSTNLSERSTRRDLELSVCLVTTNSAVRAMLQEEQARLRAHARDAEQVRPSEPVGPLTAFLARALAALLRTFF